MVSLTTYMILNMYDVVIDSVYYFTSKEKAPIDESVKLLMELEKKAQDKVDRAIRLLNTNIDVMIHSYFDVGSHYRVFKIYYVLNSIRRVVVHGVPLQSCDDEEGVAKALLKALSEDIARNLLSESEISLRDLLRN